MILSVVVGQISDATHINLISNCACMGLIALSMVVPRCYTAYMVIFLMFTMSTISIAGISATTLITMAVCIKEWVVLGEKIRTTDGMFLIFFVLIEFMGIVLDRVDSVGILIKI